MIRREQEGLHRCAHPKEVDQLLTSIHLEIASLLRSREPERNDAIAVAWAVHVGEANDFDLETVRRDEGPAVRFTGDFARPVGVLREKRVILTPPARGTRR
jgi:hypothetical protein